MKRTGCAIKSGGRCRNKKKELASPWPIRSSTHARPLSPLHQPTPPPHSSLRRHATCASSRRCSAAPAPPRKPGARVRERSGGAEGVSPLLFPPPKHHPRLPESGSCGRGAAAPGGCASRFPRSEARTRADSPAAFRRLKRQGVFVIGRAGGKGVGCADRSPLPSSPQPATHPPLCPALGGRRSRFKKCKCGCNQVKKSEDFFVFRNSLTWIVTARV